MPEKPAPAWLSEKDRRRLERQIVKAQLRKLRSQHRRSGRLLRVLNSPGVTAVLTSLITVVLGGVAGAVVVSTYQSKLKEREIEVAAHKDYLAQRQEVERRAYDLVANCAHATDELIRLTAADFNPGPGEADAADRKILDKYRFDMQLAYNDAYRRWHVEEAATGMMVLYYHDGREEVLKAWGSVEGSLNAYMKCAEDWHGQYLKDPSKTKEIGAACAEQKDAYGKALVALTQTLQTTRDYPRQTAR